MNAFKNDLHDLVADYDALAARLAATEENLERETALLTEARQQNADLMAIIDKRDEALGFVPLDKGMDMQDELRETKARLAEAGELLTQAYSVLCAYGVERSSNMDRVLMMDAIKLHYMTADSASAVQK